MLPNTACLPRDCHLGFGVPPAGSLGCFPTLLAYQGNCHLGFGVPPAGSLGVLKKYTFGPVLGYVSLGFMGLFLGMLFFRVFVLRVCCKFRVYSRVCCFLWFLFLGYAGSLGFVLGCCFLGFFVLRVCCKFRVSSWVCCFLGFLFLGYKFRVCSGHAAF